MSSKFIIKDQQIINKILNELSTELSDIYNKNYNILAVMPLSYIEVKIVANSEWEIDEAFKNFKKPIEWRHLVDMDTVTFRGEGHE